MAASSPWWRMLAGGKFGGSEVKASWGSFPSDRLRVVDGVFSGEILVGLLDIDAVPLAGGTTPS
jgi:hypothetical protein